MPRTAGQTQEFAQQSQTGMAQQPQMAIGQHQTPPAAGQQPGHSSGMAQVPGGNLKLEQALSDEMRVALHDFVESATTTAWCAEQCIDEGTGMSECIRLCRDVADLAGLNIQLLSRDSVFGPEVAEVFVSAAEACAQECGQYPHKHCQECAEVLGRAARSTRRMLSSLGGVQTAPSSPHAGLTPGQQY